MTHEFFKRDLANSYRTKYVKSRDYRDTNIFYLAVLINKGSQHGSYVLMRNGEYVWHIKSVVRLICELATVPVIDMYVSYHSKDADFDWSQCIKDARYYGGTHVIKHIISNTQADLYEQDIKMCLISAIKTRDTELIDVIKKHPLFSAIDLHELTYNVADANDLEQLGLCHVPYPDVREIQFAELTIDQAREMVVDSFHGGEY